MPLVLIRMMEPALWTPPAGWAVGGGQEPRVVHMSWIFASGLKMGRLVVAAAVALLVLGIVQLPAANVDVYPEFTPPSVQIQTEALGLSAQEVEQLITVPLEQDLLNGVPFLTDLHSQSMPGASMIDLTFEPGTDLYTARQMVQERMTQAHALPNVGSPPLMIQPLASTSRVAMISLSSSSESLIDMSILARWKLRPRLMGVPGVANVSIWGQRDRQLQVQVDPKTLNAKGISLTRLLETAGNALWVSPLTFVEASTPGTGGFIESPSQRLAVQHMLPITAPGDLANVPVEGTSLRLGDVATVAEDHQPLSGDVHRDGDPQPRPRRPGVAAASRPRARGVPLVLASAAHQPPEHHRLAGPRDLCALPAPHDDDQHDPAGSGSGRRRGR